MPPVLDWLTMKPLLLLLLHLFAASATLFPRDSGSRESKSLDGLWRFKLSPKDDPDIGFRDSWYSAPLQAIVNHWGGEDEEGVALQLQLAGRGRVADAGAQQLQRHHHRQRGEQMKVCSGIDNQLIGQVVLDLALLDGRYIFVCEGSRLPRVGLV